jgi:hypothetical protein
MRLPTTRIMSVSSMSPAFSVASVTLAVSGSAVRRGVSMVSLRVPAMRRAITWVLRKSVWVKAARIAPSSSRVAKSILRIRPCHEPRSIEACALVGCAIERKARDRQRHAAFGNFYHHLAQITPE